MTAIVGGDLRASCSPMPSSRAACRAGSAPALMTFSGVASNFAGVPLAFAFLVTLGRARARHALLLKHFGYQHLRAGFNLYSKLGPEIVYLYFQFPLMVLIIAPAIDGLKREWREASENLGATHLPVLAPCRPADPVPTLLGTMILLFGNAFGAKATAYALTGGSLNIVTVLITPPDPRRRAAQRQSRLRAGVRHDRRSRAGDRRLHLAPAPSGAVAAMKRRRRHRPGGSSSSSARLYFFLPLLGDLRVLARSRCGPSRAPQSFDCLRRASSTSPQFCDELRLFVRRSASSRSSSASACWCRPPTGSGCACRGCGRSSSSSRCCRWSSRRSSSSSAASSMYSQPPLPLTHTDIGSNVLLVVGYVDPVAALHVPRRRHRPARDRRADA